MTWPCFSISILLIAVVDVSLAVFHRYGGSSSSDGGSGSSSPSIGYAAHLGGAEAGVLMGMNLLRNFKKEVRIRT